jgi:hypothetical protein
LDYATKATRLVSCVTDIRLPDLALNTPTEASDRKKLDTLEEEFGLKTSIQRIKSALKWL